MDVPSHVDFGESLPLVVAGNIVGCADCFTALFFLPKGSSFFITPPSIKVISFVSKLLWVYFPIYVIDGIIVQISLSCYLWVGEFGFPGCATGVHFLDSLFPVCSVHLSLIIMLHRLSFKCSSWGSGLQAPKMDALSSTSRPEKPTATAGIPALSQSDQTVLSHPGD